MVMQYGFTDLVKRTLISQNQLCILLGISRRTMQRYIKKDKAPQVVMLAMRSIVDGFPIIKNKEWSGYKIIGKKLIGPNGYEYSEGELRKLDFLRCNALIPWHGVDKELSFAEWRAYIDWCNDSYITYLRGRKINATEGN